MIQEGAGLLSCVNLPPRTFKNAYAVLRCRYNLRLFRECRGFRTYIPISRERRDGDVIERAAIPGYFFVALSEARDLCRSTSSIYGLRQEYCPSLYIPRRVELSDLYKVQEFLNKEFAGEQMVEPVGPPRYDFKPGDHVRILGGNLLEGIDGMFVKYKGGLRGRIQTNIGYVDIPLQFLRNV